MSLNTSHTPDGRGGICLYNGERLENSILVQFRILIFSKTVVMKFDKTDNQLMKGKHEGMLYLTTHRIIYLSQKQSSAGGLLSFCMPFHCLRDVKLEQPLFGANYLHGAVLAQPNGNWEGDASFSLTFNKGGCVDFGIALLKAVQMAEQFHAYAEPPPYVPPTGDFFSPPPAYYMAEPSTNTGFNNQSFPDAPAASDVYMYEAPPPYSGIGPDATPYPAGTSTNAAYNNTNNGHENSGYPSAPPAYDHVAKKND